MKLPRIVAVISGKGGSGKTSVSLSLSQMLAILGYRVLLIDMDTATHGASYFFELQPPGLEEWVIRSFSDPASQEQIKDMFMQCVRPVPVKPSFSFLPSKTQFQKSEWDTDYVAKHIDSVIPYLGELFNSGEFDYVIMDCQAGVNVVTAAALKLSTHAILVTEADSVSTKALKNLENQFGASFPKFTKALINKLFLQENATYDQLTSVLRNLEFLPPIPFDMDVRDAFARNIMPLQQQRLTAYFSAIVRVLRELFPDLQEQIERMSQDLLNVEFASYEQELAKLTTQKEKLEGEKRDMTRQIELTNERRERFKRLGVPLIIIAASLIPLLPDIVQVDAKYVTAAIVFSLGYLWLFYDLFVRKNQRQVVDLERKMAETNQELASLNERIEKYTTLYLTERKKLLT